MPWPWCARAADNLAAIRLLQRIEGEDRPATAEEQAILGRFTGFGAGALAGNLFRRPGEAFRPGWAALGQELEQLVTPAELASPARSSCYARRARRFRHQPLDAGQERHDGPSTSGRDGRPASGRPPARR